MVVADNRINGEKKYKSNGGNFDHRVDVAVQCGAHCPMEHILCFTRSHWMPPLVECLRHIAPAAAMVDKFVENTNTSKKTIFS